MIFYQESYELAFLLATDMSIHHVCPVWFDVIENFIDFL